MSWLAFLWLTVVAHAEMPLPSYKDAAAHAAWYQVNALVEAGHYNQAIARAKAFESTVSETSGLEYLIGLSYRYLDDGRRAERYLKHATQMDPTYPAPWSDLGEIYLVQGRYDEARVCFQHVSDLVKTGPGSSTGPRRLAEIAAHEGDAATFEKEIREALHRGFSFREIAGLPNWRKFYADPRMRDSITKMITVYGDPSVLDSLAPGQAEKSP